MGVLAGSHAVVIAQNGTLSGAAKIEAGYTLVGILYPAAWTAADITLMGAGAAWEWDSSAADATVRPHPPRELGAKPQE